MYLSVLRIALNAPLYLKLWTQKEVELKMVIVRKIKHIFLKNIRNQIIILF